MAEDIPNQASTLPTPADPPPPQPPPSLLFCESDQTQQQTSSSSPPSSTNVDSSSFSLIHESLEAHEAQTTMVEQNINNDNDITNTTPNNIPDSIPSPYPEATFASSFPNNDSSNNHHHQQENNDSNHRNEINNNDMTLNVNTAPPPPPQQEQPPPSPNYTGAASTTTTSHHDPMNVEPSSRKRLAVGYIENSANSIFNYGNSYDINDSNKRFKAITIHGPPPVMPPPKKVNNEQWDAMFERLVNYKRAFGDCLVPKRYAADPKLGTWVETQRVQYKRLKRAVDEASGQEAVTPNKRLNAERLSKLESIGFAWSAKHIKKQKRNSDDAATPPPPPPPPTTTESPLPADTAAGVATAPTAAAAAAAAAGVPPPPMQAIPNQYADNIPFGSSPPQYLFSYPSVVPANTSANTKPNQQQVQHQIQQQRALAKQRSNDNQWEEMYQRLKVYKTWTGNCLVPRRYEADPKLAAWVETQRVLWNKDYKQQQQQQRSNSQAGKAQEQQKVNNPTAEEVSADPTTSPSFDPGKTTGELVAAIPWEAAGGPTSTGNPTSTAAQNNNNNNVKRLTPERKRKLDELGFVWSLRSKRIEDHWDQMFQQLVAYKALHGDCLVPSRYEANLKLGKWVETQRYEYTKLQRAATGQSDNGDANSIRSGGSSNNTSTDNPNATSNTTPIPPGNRPTNPRLTEERLRRLESIGFEWKVKHKMKRYYDKQWDQMFDRLLAYKATNGHCMVPKRYPPDIKLGTWVHTQRIQYRKLMAGSSNNINKKEEPSPIAIAASKPDATPEEIKAAEEEVSFRLTEDRRKRLEEVGFIWSVREGEKGTENGRIARNSYDDQWDSMFEQLKAYKERFGDCLVPKRYKENQKLGTWVDTQRVQYKKLKKKLESHGVDIDLTKPPPTVDETSNASSTPSKPLVGRLTDDRIRRLEELGFTWSLRDDWQKHYQELVQYRYRYGNCNVPARYAENRRLGIWVSAQRQQYKLMKQSQDDATKPRRSAPLTQERIDLLNQIGFTWTIRSRDNLGESWNQRLEELKEFKRAHGHCNVPSRYEANQELGVWVGTQRTQYRLYQRAKETGTALPGGTSMSEERIRQLEELGFVWALRGGEAKRENDEYSDPIDHITEEAMEAAAEAIASEEHLQPPLPPPPAAADPNSTLAREYQSDLGDSTMMVSAGFQMDPAQGLSHQAQAIV